MEELKEALGHLKKAACPEDVFGVPSTSFVESLHDWVKEKYHTLARKTHPDKYLNPVFFPIILLNLLAMASNWNFQDQLQKLHIGRRPLSQL